jgi:hypothetical protein
MSQAEFVSGEYVPTFVECNKFIGSNGSCGIAVIVKRSDHHRPRYSFDIQFSSVQGKYYRNHCVRWTVTDGQTSVISVADEVADLIDLAERWIERQIAEDEAKRKEIR